MILLDKLYDCGSHILHTNGHCGVFLPMPDPKPEGLKPQPTKLHLETLLARPWSVGSAESLLDRIRLEDCGLCRGRRVRTCSKCRGGTVFRTCDHCHKQHPCRCEECDGDGVRDCGCDRPAPIRIAGTLFNVQLVRAVLSRMSVTSGHLDYGVSGDEHGSPPAWDLVLRSGDAIGIVMGRHFEMDGLSWP